jgi:hypothetical protein
VFSGLRKKIMHPKATFMTIDDFAELISKKLVEAGVARETFYDSDFDRLNVTVQDKTVVQLRMSRLYDRFLSERPEKRDAMLQRIVDSYDWSKLPRDLSDVRSHLLPLVQSRAFLDFRKLEAELDDKRGYDGIVSFPISEHLAVSLIFDKPFRYFIQPTDLERWGISLDEAAEIAVQNLRDLPLNMTQVEENLYSFASKDSLDATRMLLTDRVSSLSLLGEPVALSVSDDAILICGSSDCAALGRMEESAREEISTEDSTSLCYVPHQLHGDEWREWHVPLDNPHSRKFYLLKIGMFEGDYRYQNRLLRELSAKRGQNVFVGSYLFGPPGGYAAWKEGVPTWLPEADAVGFVTNSNVVLGVVPWEQVRKTVGHLMTRLDFYPPRWSVTEFPSDAELRAMRPILPKQ